MVALKRVDFNTFVSLLRLPIACYQSQFWFRDEIMEFDLVNKKQLRKNNNNSVIKDLIQHYSSKWTAESTIDLVHLKQYFQRYKPQEVKSHQLDSLKSSLRLNGQWIEADVKQWTKALLIAIDNSLRSGIQATTVGVLVNDFIQILLN